MHAPPPSTMNIAVLGGGVSGLSFAWGLLRTGTGCTVTLFEQSERWGGWLRSVRTEQGAVMETGPRSMRVAGRPGQTGLWMVENLGLASSVIPVTRSHSRLIYTNQHGLVELPSGPSWLLLAKKPFSQPLLPCLVKEIFTKRQKALDSDESVHEFISRRLDVEIAEWLIDPLCRGIYAGSSHSLSVKSCFPAFYDYEQKHGSLIRGALFSKQEKSGFEESVLVKRALKEKWIMYSLKGGLQTLTDRLVGSVEQMGGNLKLSSPVSSIRFQSGKAKLQVGKDWQEFDHVVSAIPSKALAELLPEDSELFPGLSCIPSVNVATVNLLYDRQVLPQAYINAFGYLVPSHQTSNILGTVFDSSVFPEHLGSEYSTCLTVMMGGEWFTDLFGDPSNVKHSYLLEKALSDLEKHLQITADPVLAHTDVHQQCIPQYVPGHSARLSVMQQFIDSNQLPLSLLGASYSGVSVNDCITNSFSESKRLSSFINH